MRSAVLPVVLALSAAGASAQGDVVVAELVGPEDGFVGVAGPGNGVGQSFTAQAGGELTDVVVHLGRNLDLPATLHLALFDAGGDGLPAGAPLVEEVVAPALSSVFAWYVFDLSADGVQLDAHERYVVTLESEAGAGFLWSTRSGDAYAEGEALFQVFGGAWQPMDAGSPYGVRDALFSVRAHVDGEVTVFGCGVNPSGSLLDLGGVPAVGASVQLGVDNPLGTQAPGAASYLLASGHPDPAYPCGTSIPGLGMDGPGAPGELLIATGVPTQLYVGPPWPGPGAPAVFDVDVPDDPTLPGHTVFLQGLLLDPTPGSVPLGLSDAAELMIGS